jgi:hypothetical protein
VSQLPAQEAVEDLKQRRMDRSTCHPPHPCPLLRLLRLRLRLLAQRSFVVCPDLSVFERALRIDKKNEARPKVDRLYRTL